MSCSDSQELTPESHFELFTCKGSLKESGQCGNTTVDKGNDPSGVSLWHSTAGLGHTGPC